MHHYLWGNKVDEKIYLGVGESKSLSITGIENLSRAPVLIIDRPVIFGYLFPSLRKGIHNTEFCLKKKNPVEKHHKYQYPTCLGEPRGGVSERLV
jgi:hypothetical protein